MTQHERNAFRDAIIKRGIPVGSSEVVFGYAVHRPANQCNQHDWLGWTMISANGDIYLYQFKGVRS